MKIIYLFESWKTIIFYNNVKEYLLYQPVYDTQITLTKEKFSRLWNGCELLKNFLIFFFDFL